MDTSWGGFKALESGLGLGGYSAPTLFQKFSAGAYPNMSFGNIFGKLGDGLSTFSNHFNENKDLYNFGTQLATGIGGYVQSRDAAKEARKMNDFYMNQFKREQERQDNRDNAFNQAWGGSFGKVG